MFFTVSVTVSITSPALQTLVVQSDGPLLPSHDVSHWYQLYLLQLHQI